MSKITTFDVENVSINGEFRYLEFFQASIGIGTQHWPCIKLVTHKERQAEQELLALTSEDVANDMKARQAAIFSERYKPDVNISISVKDNNNNNKFDFNGLMVGPTYSFSAHNVELADQAIPDYTKINFLNLSIYKDHADTAANFDYPSLDIAGTICNMAIGQVDKWMEKAWAIFARSPVKEYLRAQHSVNQKVKTYWEQLLRNSNGTFGWNDVNLYLKDSSDYKLRETIANIATQSSGTFSTVIDKFAEEFQCIYVPGWNSIGKFKSKKALFANPKDLIVNPISMTINTSNGFGLLPTAYVGVETTDSTIDTTQNSVQSKTFICVPEENVNTGQMIRILGPKWLQEGTVTIEVVEQEQLEQSRGPDVANIEEDRKSVYADVKKIRKQVASGLHEYGLCAYTYLSLADSKAEITMPINFKLEIGERYKVQNKDKKTLFTGLLAHVTHVISTKSKSPMAHTTATFTHIEIGDFELPGVLRE